MPQAPNTGNYTLGKGILTFKRDGDSLYRDLGNCTEFTLEMEVETLEHFSSRYGVNVKDLEVVTQTSGTLAFTLDEYSADNFALAVMGDVLVATDPVNFEAEVTLFTNTSISGSLRFYGQNDVGQRVDIELDSVTLRPSGEVGFISDDWATIEIEGSINIGSGVNTKVKFRKKLNVVPQNVIAPYLVHVSGAGTVAIPKVGDVLQARVGTWLDEGTYAYQWQRGAVDIVGATNSNYTVVSGDIGAALRVKITATNGVGAAPVVFSPATGNVIA